MSPNFPRVFISSVFSLQDESEGEDFEPADGDDDAEEVDDEDDDDEENEGARGVKRKHDVEDDDSGF